MCGRFSHRLSWQEIHALYQLTSAPSNLEPRYNVCPTDTINAVVERDGRRELVPMRWGLVPYWWKDKANKTPATFNARADSAGEAVLSCRLQAHSVPDPHLGLLRMENHA